MMGETCLTWIISPIPRFQRINRQLPSPTKACAGNLDHEENFSQPTASPSQAATPLLDALQNESRRVRANFFCPGHKQGAATLPALKAALGPAALALDLPELPALDNLFAPEAVLEESENLAADTFTQAGSDDWNTFFLVNGSTCGIEAAMLAAVRPGRKVILPRNAHQSAVHALVLSGAVPIWVQPLYDAKNDLLHGVATETISKALETHKGEVDAVLVISPTYHGACSDVASIAAVTHANNALLIIDEAHGAHFNFHHLLPESATNCGADFVVQSTHKTLTALSQAAMLHVRRESIGRQQVAAALQLVQSTSPNYILLASLEAARALMDEQGEDLMSHTIDLARNCAVRIASLDGFSVLGIENVGMTATSEEADTLFMYALDPTRVTVLLPGGATGYDIDTHLIDRFGVYSEFPSFKHITFVFTPGNTRAEVDRLVTSLALFEATSHEGMPDMNTLENEIESRSGTFGEYTGITPREAFFAPATTVPADEAVGRICVESLCPYPPGVPVLVSGERVTQECVTVLKQVLDSGGSVSGASDDSLSTIRVAADETQLGIKVN